MRTPQRRRGHLRETDGANLSLAHQIRECTDAVLDGHGLVPTMQIIEIDGLRLEAPQAILAVLLEGRRPAVDHAAHTRLGLHALDAALARQCESRAMWRECASHQFLVGAKTVERGGIEVRDAKFQGPQENARRGVRRRRNPVGVAHVHAPEADGRYGKGTEFALAQSRLHCVTSRYCMC